jgi:chromosome segregation ATPase
LANKILWIENERVQTYPGSYGEFQHKYKSKLQTEERVKSKTESKSPGKKEKTKDPVSTGVKSLHQKISALEEELTEKQRLIEEIKQELQNTESLSMEQINGLSSDFETKTRELNEINARIDDLMEDLIRLEDS